MSIPAPTFGVRSGGCPYVIRPCAYALVQDGEGRIALVRTPAGWFLPGGGIDKGETPEEAIEREVREECGLLVKGGGIVTAATEIVYSETEKTCFEKQSLFITATLVGMTAPLESDHELFWMDPSQAMEKLSHESHRWGVERGMQSHVRSRCGSRRTPLHGARVSGRGQS